MAFVYHAVCFKKYIKCSLAQTSFTADGEKEEQFNGSPPRPQPRGPRTPPGPPPPDDDEDEPMPVSGSQALDPSHICFDVQIWEPNIQCTKYIWFLDRVFCMLHWVKNFLSHIQYLIIYSTWFLV